MHDVAQKQTVMAPARNANKTALAQSPLQQLADASAPVNALSALQVSADAQSRPIQLYKNLHNLYHDMPEADNKTEWLERFTIAQKILNQKDLVNDSLEFLSREMLKKDQTLQQTLNAAMLAKWGEQDRVMTGFVPQQTFLAVIRDGKLFRDYVGRLHGVHSHQIQWFVLQRFLGANEAITLYKEAGNPRWAKEQKFMWDNIVDGTKGIPGNPEDFTVPENLETYLYTQFTGEAATPLTREANTQHEERADNVASLEARYPSEAKFTAPLSDAIPIISDWDQRGIHEATLRGIHDEVITNTTGFPWNRKTIEWTGFVKGNGAAPNPYFVPTVGRFVA